jgi:hypothetical protein
MKASDLTTSPVQIPLIDLTDGKHWMPDIRQRHKVQHTLTMKNYG